MTRGGERDQDQTRRRFVERLGGALADAGLPPLGARVFSALLISESGRMTSVELTAALGVSAGGVSGAVRYLAGIGMIRREREPGSRKYVYVVADDAWSDMMLRERQVLPPIIAALAFGAEELPRDAAAHDRIALSHEFLEFLRSELLGIADRWAARHPR